jgi:hypothetical protein
LQQRMESSNIACWTTNASFWAKTKRITWHCGMF